MDFRSKTWSRLVPNMHLEAHTKKKLPKAHLIACTIFILRPLFRFLSSCFLTFHCYEPACSSHRFTFQDPGAHFSLQTIFLRKLSRASRWKSSSLQPPTFYLLCYYHLWTIIFKLCQSSPSLEVCFESDERGNCSSVRSNYFSFCEKDCFSHRFSLFSPSLRKMLWISWNFPKKFSMYTDLASVFYSSKLWAISNIVYIAYILYFTSLIQWILTFPMLRKEFHWQASTIHSS